VFIDQD